MFPEENRRIAPLFAIDGVRGKCRRFAGGYIDHPQQAVHMVTRARAVQKLTIAITSEGLISSLQLSAWILQGVKIQRGR